jgi:hypothetical protein
LPAGVQLVDNGNGTAKLVGTPAAGSNSSYSIVITAQNVINNVTQTAMQTFKLTVVQPPTFNSNSATFVVGLKNSVTITTNPGQPATTKVTEKGKLPMGLAFVPGKNGMATISGTPAAGTGGTYTVTLLASNGVWTTPQTFTVTVDQPPTFATAAGTSFAIGQSGTFLIKTKGFPLPGITMSGTLPTGVHLVDNGNGTATLSGVPAAGSNASYTITLTATNVIGLVTKTATQTFTLKVNESPIFTSVNSATFTTGTSGTFTIQTLPSTLPTAKLTEAGALPKGVTFVDNHNGTATLKGTPAKGSNGTYTVIVTASDGVLPAALQVLTIVVN